MNCRRVKWLAADWAAGMLSSAEAERVERHGARCAACARLLGAETQLRRDWSERTEMKAAPVDYWPRLSLRLAPGRRRASLVPRLVWSGVAVLVVAATAGLHSWAPSAEHPSPVVKGAVKTAPVAISEGAPMEALASWSGMNDVAASNPVVDDPAGTATEEIWTHIK